MSVALVTGCGGLVGSETVAFLAGKGMDVVGIDNDMRGYFFGREASTAWRVADLKRRHSRFTAHTVDIRDASALSAIVRRLGRGLSLVVHAAAQPSHDWAAREPMTDFGVNALGTLNLLEAVRHAAPDAAFVFLSTNKVYGDSVNRLPMVELDTRYELAPGHRYFADGIDETLSIDQSTHSLFGVSKLSADLMVQEYGRYFGMRTACLRGGCLTGAGHSSSTLHGFLAHLMKCAATGARYTVFGHKGKQVRDNLHARDLVEAIWLFAQEPRCAKVYNMGGGRFANCSMIEAIGLCEEIAGRPLRSRYDETARVGDHIWWISDISAFQRDYPRFQPAFDIRDTLRDIHDMGRQRWARHA